MSNDTDSQFGPIFHGESRSFDFTLLFEDTVLAITPASLFLVAACARVVWLVGSPKKVGESASRQVKLTCLSAFAALQLVILLLWATNSRSGTNASIPAASLDFAAACLLFLLSSYEHSRSVAPSTIIGLYMLVSLPLDISRLRTLYLLKSESSRSIATVFSLSTAVKLCTLIAEATEKRNVLLAPYQHLLRTPEVTSGIYNKAIFWWVNPLLRTGFSRILFASDLYELDNSLNSSGLQQRFSRKWRSRTKFGSGSLIAVTMGVLKWQFLLSAIPRLLIIGLKYAQPFLIERTISYISNRQDQPANIGWALVGSYALVYSGMAVLSAAYHHLQNRCIIQIRGGLITLVYTKTLDLNLTALDPTASLTLMSTDVQRITDSLEWFNDVWGAILELAVAVVLLQQRLGLATLGPGLVFLCAIVGTIAVTVVLPEFQRRWVEAIQTRVSFTSDLLGSMRSIKLLGMSKMAKNLTQSLRVNETKFASRFRLFLVIRLIFQNATNVFAPFVTFALFAIQANTAGRPLNLASAFSVLSILQLVDTPLAILSFSLPNLVASATCFARIQEYLVSPSRMDHRLSIVMAQRGDGTKLPSSRSNEEEGVELQSLRRSTTERHAEDVLVLKHCSIGWKPDEAVVHEIDFCVKSGSFTMIIGPVGCGKSTLIKGILGETPSLSGFVYIGNTSIAFADQQAWIQNCTIKDAIKGESGNSLDESWYMEVLDCCGLLEDIDDLPARDDTVIGSQGISLSGGQKARLALARAVFSKHELLILDDVFSGLDNDTEELIFRKLFGKNGPLRRMRTAVILVTHAVHRLPYADHVVALDSTGRISEQGSYQTLQQAGGYVRGLDIRFKQEQEHDETPAVAKAVASPVPTRPSDDIVQNLLRKTGDWRTYKHYFSAAGWPATFAAVLWTTIHLACINAPGLLIKYWAQASPSKSTNNFYIGIWGSTSLVAALTLVLVAWQFFLDIVPRASRNLHLTLLEAVLSAPLSFFTRTDTGNTLNRFSSDMNMVDNDLPNAAVNTLFNVILALITGGLMASTASYFLATVPVVLLTLYGIQKYYLRTSRQMRILDLETKAPLYSHFSETLAGLASVRAFGWTEAFDAKHLDLLDRSQKPFYLLLCIQRWLAVVLDLLVFALVVILMSVIVAKRHDVNPALVGLGLVNVMNFNTTLVSLISTWTQMETSIGAIARLRDFVSATENENKAQEQVEPPPEWPANGSIEIKNFSASYSADSNIILNDIDLTIQPGEKLGICGRSGSGKSSLLASLFHLLEFRKGSMIIDGLDIATLPRETLRQRLNVIPQDAFWLRNESVRFNLDPWHDRETSSSPFTDEELIIALTKCHLYPTILAKGGLDATMDAELLSHGQRQLFCLARAILRKSTSKVVVLDEVSASVDVHTDTLMQGIIREEFEGCSIVSVAHRLGTIVDFDRVAVLSAGRLVEVGVPRELLGKEEGGWFRELYES